MADGYTGKNAVLTWKGTTYNSYYRTADQTENEDQVDLTAGDDAWDVSTGGTKHGEISMELLMPQGTAGTAVYGAFALGEEGTAVIQPEGTASGKPTSTINTARVISRGRPLPRADAVTFSITLKYNDAAGPSDT